MDYSKLKVPELKAELASKGLATTGLKKELLERLQASAENVNGETNDELAYDETTTATVASDLPAEHTEDPVAAVIVDLSPGLAAPVEMDVDAVEHSSISTSVPLAAAVAVDASSPIVIPAPIDDEEEDRDTLKRRHDEIEVESDSGYKRARSPLDSPIAVMDDLDTLPATESIYISNLARPYTVGQLKTMLEEFGAVSFFWIDAVKSHAYVTFESVSSCLAAHAALDNESWPPQTGKPLSVMHIPSDHVALLVAEEESTAKQQNGKKATLERRKVNGEWRFELLYTAPPPPAAAAPSASTIDKAPVVRMKDVPTGPAKANPPPVARFERQHQQPQSDQFSRSSDNNMRRGSFDNGRYNNNNNNSNSNNGYSNRNNGGYRSNHINSYNNPNQRFPPPRNSAFQHRANSSYPDRSTSESQTYQDSRFAPYSKSSSSNGSRYSGASRGPRQGGSDGRSGPDSNYRATKQEPKLYFAEATSGDANERDARLDE